MGGQTTARGPHETCHRTLGGPRDNLEICIWAAECEIIWIFMETWHFIFKSISTSAQNVLTSKKMVITAIASYYDVAILDTDSEEIPKIQWLELVLRNPLGTNSTLNHFQQQCWWTPAEVFMIGSCTVFMNAAAVMYWSLDKPGGSPLRGTWVTWLSDKHSQVMRVLVSWLINSIYNTSMQVIVLLHMQGLKSLHLASVIHIRDRMENVTNWHNPHRKYEWSLTSL